NLYRNVSTQLTGDSDLVPDAVLTISGANAIRGVAYSSRLDVLVLSDYDQARIYIIEEASQYFAQASSTVTPSRVITGSSTGSMGPVDVSLDDREGAGNLYVADQRAKSVLRFKISDQGNVQPQSVVSFPLSPEAVYIDARGQIQPVE